MQTNNLEVSSRTVPAWRSLPNDLKAKIMSILPPRSRAALIKADKDAYTISISRPTLSSQSAFHEELKTWLMPQLNSLDASVRTFNQFGHRTGVCRKIPSILSDKIVRLKKFLDAFPSQKNETEDKQFSVLTARMKVDALHGVSVGAELKTNHQQLTQIISQMTWSGPGTF
jgi:hypothetical protein